MRNITIVFIVLISVAFYSCQKVIDVNLNSSSPKYVIEANINNQPGSYIVKVKQTKDFDEDNNFPGVNNALIIITDSTINHADTLKETKPGIYITNTLTGVPGHVYNLYIKVADDEFLASCTMPMPVLLDSLYSEKLTAFGNDNITVTPVYTDPPGTANYYHFAQYINGKAVETIFVRSDDITDGKVANQPLYAGRDNDIKSGDSVTVELQCIDKAVYNYYNGLTQTINQNSATPANPVSNISGGALGYFSAYSMDTKTIKIP